MTTYVHDVATTCSHHSVFMRITINNGIDSSSSVINNNNNVVLDAAPASMVQLEAVNKIVADGSTVTPAIMSEIASVNMYSVPSSLHFARMALFQSNKKDPGSSIPLSDINDSTTVDFSCTHTLRAFGKLNDNRQFLNELKLNYNGQGEEIIDDNGYSNSVDRILNGLDSLKGCIDSYSKDERMSAEYTNSEYLANCNSKQECKIKVNDILFSEKDVDSVAKNILKRYYPELDFAKDLSLHDSNPGARLFSSYESSPQDSFDKGQRAQDNLLGEATVTDLDDAVGLKLESIYEQLLNVSVSETFMKCFNDMTSASRSYFSQMDRNSMSPRIVFQRTDVRDFVTQGKPKCYNFNWDPKERLDYVRSAWKLNDKLKNLYIKLYKSNKYSDVSFENNSKWTESAEKLENDLKVLQESFFSLRQ